MGSKMKSDPYLYLFSFGLVFFFLLFIITYSVSIPPLDVSMEWDKGGFRITFTGVAEIILAICCGIGVIWRKLKE